MGAPIIRTCIGCGQKEAKQNLFRIVLVSEENRVEPDPVGNRPGRGVYLHRRVNCIQKGIERRRLDRAFREQVTVSSNLADALIQATGRVAM